MIPAAALPGAIETLGWLELPLDDAPALIVVGLNEGFVPSSRNGDLFLPNELRRGLSVDDNDRRYARDAYALSMLAASRPGFKIIVPRRSADGEPLLPSRLLFACPDEALAERTRLLFGPPAAQTAKIIVPGGLRVARARSVLAIPRPEPLEHRVTSMRVTEFRDYLACPYRYYLRHRLGLESLADMASELDAAEFGSVTHEALRRFGGSPATGSTDPREIEDFLNLFLAEIALARFGEATLPAVSLQLEQIRLRLKAFAAWQARWRQSGWEIHYIEQSILGDSSQIVVDGEPMFLRGRIDRIDVHESSNECVVFDYKTGDSAKTPDQAHRNKATWIDLQLPLYRRLVVGLHLPTAPRVGYIVLPKDTTKTGERLAVWSEAELADADHAAEGVVRQVRREVFWPPTSPPPAFSEDFAAICQDGGFGAALAHAAEAEAP
jgi:CRISPR/Cas system-associated exonuclease Cas4 (RecB family)